MIRDPEVRNIQNREVEGFDMKKLILVLVAAATVCICTASAEAGWRYRWGYRGCYAPVVRPYVAPVYVARPVYVAPSVVVPQPVYRSYRVPSRVYVGSGYYGGGVQVHTPGFGLSISY
jgi:hypothetical protein